MMGKKSTDRTQQTSANQEHQEDWRKTQENHVAKTTKTSTAQEFAGPSQWCCDFVRNTMRPMGWKARIGKGKRKGSWKCPPGS